MHPSDTQIERMAETFAERTPYLRPERSERVEAWREALHFGRDQDVLTQIESHMEARGVLDKVARDAWETAREYPAPEEAPTEVED